MSEEVRVWRSVADAAARGRPVVLATIVRAKGSTPRGVGSKMAIVPKEGAVGTIGGGCGEGQVVEEAAGVLAEGRARVVRVDLTDDLLGWSPAVCGGIFDVLLEPFRPGSRA